MLIAVRDNVPQTCERKKKSQKCACTDEGEEESIVAPSYAIVDPDTMMIQGLYTVVAHSAMVAPWWAPDITCLAIFDRYIHGSSLRGRQSNHNPVVCGWSNSKRIIVIGWRERMYVPWKDLAGSVLRFVFRLCQLTPGSTNDA